MLYPSCWWVNDTCFWAADVLSVDVDVLRPLLYISWQLSIAAKQ